MLSEGDFHAFEKSLQKAMLTLSDEISQTYIDYVSQSPIFEQKQKDLAKQLGLKKLVKRPASIQLYTGTKINFLSFYAKKAPADYKGNTRHLSYMIWRNIKKSGLKYASIVCLLSVLCPSFDLCKSLLRFMGIQTHFNRVRDLSLALADACMEDRAGAQLAAGETLEGKRVSIGIDGGRTRTRQYKLPMKTDGKEQQSFDTPWREPKLFVISCIDENGKIDKTHLPIYDSSFGDENTIDLLATYLEKLHITDAKSVQIVGDGAPWIWNRMKPMLMALGVEEDKIEETLDYYHAMEHLHELKQYFPKADQQSVFEKLSYWLWRGEIKQMRGILKQYFTTEELASFTPWQYFEKHYERIDYQLLKKKKLPKGSGIVESGIRRIINLRFKSPSSFWYPENVEKLILMRSIALSGRWSIMIDNLKKNNEI